MQDAWRRGFAATLIIEDDCILRDDAGELLGAWSSEIEAQQWGILYLGCYLFTDGGQVSEHLGRAAEAYHTHAYAVRRAAIPPTIRAIARALEQRDHCFDAITAPLRKLYTRPMLAIQEPGWSATAGRVIDRTREYFPTPQSQSEFRRGCREFDRSRRMAIATLWTDCMADVAALTLPGKKDYCRRWGIPLIELHGKHGAARDRPPAWSKIPMLREHLPWFDWIFWTDADAAILRSAAPMDAREFLDDDHDVIWTDDENGPNTGSFFIRNSPASLLLLEQAHDLYGKISNFDPRGRFQGRWDQAAIRTVVDAGTAGVKVKTLPKRSINSYDTDYRPGDFILHAAGIDKLRRLREVLNAEC